MIATPSKRICINYCCPPLWNMALNFLFWIALGVAGVVISYLFLMYLMDTAVQADTGPHQGANIGNPANYGNVVKQYLAAIPFLGKFLYP